MAEHLNIERSALSRELSYMKRDGLIIIETVLSYLIFNRLCVISCLADDAGIALLIS